MTTITPRRSLRVPHNHTPKMSERKKGLFQGSDEPPRESLTQHRRLPVVESDSDSDDCDLGIISTLDSSSGDEQRDQNAPKTPERRPWHETRSHTKRLLQESHNLKNFIKSPFTLKKYQTRSSCPERKCSPMSTPVTPHVQNHPGTPSSAHSCTSIHTTSSNGSRARKSLASLIADTESCSSSLKDLNFDTDSGTDTKENTPKKSNRKSNHKQKLTPKFASFKDILKEQKTNVTSSPVKIPFVSLIKMDISNTLSPTEMLKTPHTPETNSKNLSPPKIYRRPALEIAESPENDFNCDISEKSHKRLRNDSLTSESGPNSKYPRLDTSSSAPKARLSLFNSEKLKEILSAKSFYGKRIPEFSSNLTNKITSAIAATTVTHKRRSFTMTHRSKSRKSGQINLGVKHKIRKPKVHKNKIINLNSSVSPSANDSVLNNTTVSNSSANNTSLLQSSQELDNDKLDPFDSEKQTIDALLSQWTEEEVPESELSYSATTKSELSCFNRSVIEDTKQIFNPVTATPVQVNEIPHSEVIVELGASTTCPKVVDVVMKEPEAHTAIHGVPMRGFLPVEGGYIVVDEASKDAGQEDLTDLDEIERELKMLDEQILQMAQSNNIDATAVLASTENVLQPAITDVSTVSTEVKNKTEKPTKLFSIFNAPNSGTTPPSKATESLSKKPLLKSVANQYVIDAGQKHFGATQCKECGVIYQIGDPQDEHDHLVHHNATDVLKFNGWKEERVVGKWEDGRCICVRGTEPGWKRVSAILTRIVHPQLGYGAALPADRIYTYSAYLYIEKKQIIGCMIVEPKVKAFKLIPGDPDCCSVEEYPVKCGVSRIWTHINHRRRGVAARMLDCARASFLYGEGLQLTDIAFSAPTTAGKSLAAHYCGTEHFLVYLD